MMTININIPSDDSKKTKEGWQKISAGTSLGRSLVLALKKNIKTGSSKGLVLIPRPRPIPKNFRDPFVIPWTAFYHPSPFLTGAASHYHDWFNGRKTANGDRFYNEKLTAAINDPSLYGKIVLVECIETGRFVEVLVNDCGAFDEFRCYRGRGCCFRVCDLSKAAYSKISPVPAGQQEDKGTIHVRIFLRR